MLLSFSQAAHVVERLYGCRAYRVSQPIVLECWREGHPNRMVPVVFAPARPVMAVGWRDGEESWVYVSRRWADREANRVGLVLVSVAQWLAALHAAAGEVTQVCALAVEDDEVVLVEQRPRPRILPTVALRRWADEGA